MVCYNYGIGSWDNLAWEGPQEVTQPSLLHVSTGVFASTRTAPPPSVTPQLRPFPTAHSIKGGKKLYNCCSPELPARPAACTVFLQHLWLYETLDQNHDTQ